MTKPDPKNKGQSEKGLGEDIGAFAENEDSLPQALLQFKRLIRIGTALSAERNIGKLLELIVDEARKFTHADGGTLYTMSEDEAHLHFAIVQNDTLGVRMGGTGGDITWEPLDLIGPDGQPNHGQVSVHVALTGKSVNISDVYDAEGFDFRGTREFDGRTGYRSRSMLVLPMKNHENDIIGVLQLLNARYPKTEQVIPFSTAYQEMTECLASQAAVALSNNRLIHDLENLMDAFICSIATAVDEKSPYTGGHVRRVSDLTMSIAHSINAAREEPWAEVFFSDDELKELRIASWLHDVGKIATPEHVIDKATKLETILDAIEVLKLRFELYRLQKKDAADRKAGGDLDKILMDEFRFLAEVNRGDSRMSDAMIEQVKAIAERTWDWEGERKPLLSNKEVENLSIRQGTLNARERDIVKNHAALTYKILAQLPFPKKLRHVPEYAANHHETPDGKGYPQGLAAQHLSLQARILGLADVFEALTAKDRPYKKGKTLSEALTILKGMVADQKVDRDLFDLFVGAGIHLDYGRKELMPSQIDVSIDTPDDPDCPSGR